MVRRVVFAVAVAVTALIGVFAGQAVLSGTGLLFDPHGYGVFAGILFAAVLSPAALGLWKLYRSLRRRGD
ncbi:MULTISPECIES: hypothetical protein [Catenuloplanes]|uniref:Uncharacterized protein n=1 Tax=Catenuloplanes niger TaxID=587534 RepID=A0AAE4CPZ8_9ACTN|nr:hypothetical protein [Catenuloplanes niger]MDR7319962.1 hypothetical protein [Catenuloplanes niger]